MGRYTWTVALVALFSASFLAGCQGGGGDDGVDQDAVQKLQEPLKSAAVRSGGDWSKLSDEERKLFLDRARGNEESARFVLKMMAGGATPAGPPGRNP